MVEHTSFCQGDNSADEVCSVITPIQKSRTMLLADEICSAHHLSRNQITNLLPSNIKLSLAVFGPKMIFNFQNNNKECILYPLQAPLEAENGSLRAIEA